MSIKYYTSWTHAAHLALMILGNHLVSLIATTTITIVKLWVVMSHSAHSSNPLLPNLLEKKQSHYNVKFLFACRCHNDLIYLKH